MRLSQDLRKRTKAFGSLGIRVFIALPRRRDEVGILAKQMVRAATSVSAHAREASRARSDAEFCSKINGLLQEADETQLWLEFLKEDCVIEPRLIDPMWQEADELMAIFATICDRTRRKTPSQQLKG